MASQEKTFSASEQLLADLRYSSTVQVVNIVFFSLFLVWKLSWKSFARGELSLFAVVPVLVIGICFVDWIFRSWTLARTLRLFRQMKLRIGTDGLVYDSFGVFNKTIIHEVAWDSIRKVDSVEDLRGEPASARIATTSARPFSVYGLESMAEIVRMVQCRLPLTAEITTRRQRVDRHDPATNYIVGVASMLLPLAIVDSCIW